MKTRNTIILSFILILLTRIGYSQEYHVRVGFFGNSITIGAGLSNPTQDCYPAQLAKMLQTKYGDTCIVKNFAVSGRTMLKHGDFPLWKEGAFKDGWYFAPDIVFICLGTNDTKPYNWDAHKDEFLGDYLSMIDTFKLRNPDAKFIVCYPPPAYQVVFDIRDSVIVHGVIPFVDSVLSKREATLVDFYHPLEDSVHLFPDYIHPGVAGSKVMAQIAYDKIIESDIVHEVVKGGTFVTSLKTSMNEIRIKDTSTISWITVNADSAFLNGQKVDPIGSLKVSPHSATNYKLVAYGDLGEDSLTILQKVYIPVIASIVIEPYRLTIRERETANLKILYYDQKSKILKDTVTTATWSITEGSGSLENETDTSVTFVAGAIGRSKVQAQVGTLTFLATITTEEGSGNKKIEFSGEQSGYPNPCDKVFNLPVNAVGAVTLKIYDLNGSLKLEKTENYSASGNHTFSITVEGLKSGIYIYDAEFSGKHLTGKINKQ